LCWKSCHDFGEGHLGCSFGEELFDFGYLLGLEGLVNVGEGASWVAASSPEGPLATGVVWEAKCVEHLGNGGVGSP